MKALLDTDILSEILKSKDPRVIENAAAYRARGLPYTTSTMTVMEIVKGLCRLHRDAALQKFLSVVSHCEVLTLEPTSAELAGRIYADLERNGRVIGVADVIIAAIAIHHGLPLITGNTAHYAQVQAVGYPLVLANWREPI